MRRTFGFTFTLALVAFAAVAVAVVSASAQTRLQANKAAARRDALKLVAAARLPTGLTPIEHGPAFALNMATILTPGKIYAADRRWWSTSLRPESVIAFIKAHKPAGASAETTGSAHNYDDDVSGLSVQFSWPSIPQALYDRTLTISAVTPPSGTSVVVAQSQSDWLVPRSAAETVPSGVRSVLISLRIGSGVSGVAHMRTRTYVVSRSARMAALVSAIDSLPIVQPGAEIACTLELVNSPTLSLAFRAAGRTGHVGSTLARAEVRVYPGADGGSGANSCDPIDFWIGGREQMALTSQTLVSHVGALIGVRIS